MTRCFLADRPAREQRKDREQAIVGVVVCSTVVRSRDATPFTKKKSRRPRSSEARRRRRSWATGIVVGADSFVADRRGVDAKRGLAFVDSAGLFALATRTVGRAVSSFTNRALSFS